jgi:hypothetical protein
MPHIEDSDSVRVNSTVCCLCICHAWPCLNIPLICLGARVSVVVPAAHMSQGLGTVSSRAEDGVCECEQEQRIGDEPRRGMIMGGDEFVTRIANTLAGSRNSRCKSLKLLILSMRNCSVTALDVLWSDMHVWVGGEVYRSKPMESCSLLTVPAAIHGSALASISICRCNGSVT